MNDGEDAINLNDDQPELIFSPDVNGKHSDGLVPPFYSALLYMIIFYTMQCQI